jgi:RND family efflux transporter MFP subunit
VAQAQALLATARADFTRAQRLHAKQYLSDAAYERAEAQYKAAQAQARALSAQAAATGAQADFFTLRAPYAGWVSRVDAVAGDLATPGRVLVTVYDPQSLRVSASVPESVATLVDTSRPASVSVPGAAAAALSTAPVTVLPGVDAQTHTAVVRAALPSAEAAAHGLVPGQFARVDIPLRSGAPRAAAAVITVPQAAVVRRGELDAVYVVDAQGHPELRQVRLGRTHGDRVEIQAGVSAGERVALDPVAAARATQQ